MDLTKAAAITAKIDKSDTLPPIAKKENILAKGVIAHFNKDYAEAKEHYQQLLKLEPNSLLHGQCLNNLA